MKSKKLKKLIAMTIIATTVAANMPLGINSNVAFASDVPYTSSEATTAGFTFATINGGNEYQITGFDKSKTGAIIIPSQIDGKSVTSIGNTAFHDCSGLTSISIPSSITSIGNYAFDSCSGLTSISIPSNVTSIGHYAFEYCSGLTSISIPSSVTSIGDGVFSDCSGLTSISIPSSVTSIGKGTFFNCSGLTSISIPSSITSIGNTAFELCSGLKSISIPSSVTSISEATFLNCSGLKSISIPSSVTSIGNGVFSGCSGLKSISIPSSVTSIGDGAFYDCSGLTSISIPSSVTSIGEATFFNCSGLTSISIPSSITSIGNATFFGCSGLTSISIPSSVISIANSAFESIDNNAIFYVPNDEVKNLLEQNGYPTSGTNQKIIKIPFNLKYDDNNSTGGSVPTDSTDYTSAQTVTVANNTGNLVRTSYIFDGWNTADDGSGTSYAVGDVLNIAGNTTLYAKWKVAISTAPSQNDITVTNNIGTSDTIAVSNLSTGATVNVYDAATGGNLIGTGVAGADGIVRINGTLGAGSGNVYVTITETGKTESSPRIGKSYVAEGLPAPVTPTGINITNKASSSSSSSSSSKKSSSSSSTGEINVAVTDGSGNNSVIQTVMERTTASDGTKKDTIDYTVSKAEQTVEALKKEGKDVARIVVPDTNDEVSEDKVNISAATISVLSKGNVKLEIDTENARISLPTESIQGLSENGAVQGNGDLYFRLVPVKDEKKQQEIQTRANQEKAVKEVSGNSNVQVLGRPMEVETNMSKKTVDITLPLKGVTIPSDSAQREAFLKDLGIFIEHSDGEKVLSRGEIVEYAPGVLGLKFTVNKFSTFTIVKLNQKITSVEAWQNTAQGWKYIKDGQPVTGWNLINGYWYLMDSTGIMETDWRQTNGTWYLLKNDGAMATGWEQINGYWYLLNANGSMMTGWQKVNGQWYYLYEDGSMASDTTINGYSLDINGAWIK